MGLLLSILVFSVGVLEALACVRHIQQGILPAWAPRHVTSSSGRRLLREHWRKSTSLDDGSGDGLGSSGDAGALPNGAPSRRHLGDRKGSLDEEQPGRPRPPPLTLSESPHHVRSPDIHWPEPVPHSPAKHIEQTLPSPVAEVPGDVPTWPADAAPPAILQRRRTSTTETLPHEEHGQAEPLRAAAPAAPPPSFAREGREPPRHKPAKASTFEEARVQPFAPPPPKAPEVAAVNHHPPAPRAALVHSIEVTSSAQSSLDDLPAPWPIVNIDTVATSDEEGDVSPSSNLASRRVSFDPVPTVVVIDNEKPITEERERGTILAPSIRITDDLESVLRKELPSVIDDIIQQALGKVNEVLESRQNGPLNGVSFLIENFVSKSDKVLKGPLSGACAEEYKDHFEPTVQSVIEMQKDMNAVLSAIPQENKLGRSKEEIGAKHLGHPTPLENEVSPNTGLQKSHPRENEVQISNASADQISSSAPAEKGYANILESELSSPKESNSEIEAGKAVLLDNTKLDNLSTSSESVSQTNVQNSIQDVKERLGNSEELIPESLSGSENETYETGIISNCAAEPAVIPNIVKSAPISSQSLHDITNENEAVENEIRNEMQGDDGSEESTPGTTWKLQSPTAGESLILGDAAVATTAAVPAELGSIASTPASSAALPPSESREKAASAPLASASESPVASAAPHIPSSVPESPVAPGSISESIPLDAVSTDQAIPNALEPSSPTKIINTSTTPPSPNVSVALDSPATTPAPEIQVAPAAPSTPVSPAAPAAAVDPAVPEISAQAVAPTAPSVPAAPISPPSPAAAVVPTAPVTPAAAVASTAPVAPTPPAVPAAAVAPAAPTAPAAIPSPATPAASTTPPASTTPDAPPSTASAVPAASAVSASASPVASAAPVAAATPVAPTSPAPAVPTPAPAASKARPASAAPQPPAPAPAVGAPLKEEEPSGAPSSPARPAAGGRAAAPQVSAAPAPQREAFWVSDASSSPAPHALTSSPKATFNPAKKATPVSQPPPSKAPPAPWTQKTSSAGSTKQPFSGFQKSVSAEPAKSPQPPAFTKVGSLSKTPSSPTFVKKQFGAPAPTPLKPTSPFGTKVTSSAPPPFYKPAAASSTPSFLASLTPKTSSAFNSRFSDPSPPVSAPVPRPPSPAPAPPVEKREESSSQIPTSPSPSSDPPPPPRPATAPSLAPGSSRPTSPPPRDPQEVVRRLAELRRTNPTVATEVLLSILGFKFPGS